MIRQGRHSACRLRTLAALAGMLAAACAAPQPPTAPGRAVNWRDQTPQGVLAHLATEMQAIEDLSAAFALGIDPAPPGRPGNLQGVLFYARRSPQPAVRIKGLGLFGRTLFDMVQIGAAVQLYLPEQRTLYRGRHKDDGAQGNPWAEAFGVLFADFANLHPSPDSRLVFEGDGVVLSLRDGQLRLDRDSGRVLVWRSSKGTVVYGDYHQTATGIAVPGRIDFTAADGSRRAVCRLAEVSVNRGSLPGFDLAAEYEPESFKDLEELE